jgi:hypothetical protein
MGGADVSLGTIAQSLAGLVAWRVNMDLWTSKEAEAHRYTSSLRTLYSDGGINDRALYDEIMSGKTNIEERLNGDYRAKTEAHGDGTKTMYLGKEALADGSRFGMNILLAHEAYRNGVDDGEAGQKQETQEAVVGHIHAALALSQIYGMGSIGEAMSQEVNAYLDAIKNRNEEALAHVIGGYDASGDYWRLRSRKDGSHVLEWDGSKDLTTIFEDKDENGNWKEVSRTTLEIGNGSTTRGQALYLILGDKEAMKKAAMIAYQKGDGKKIEEYMKLPEAQRQEKIGEYLMESQGMKFTTKADGTGGSWTGNSRFTLTDKKLPSYLMVNKDANGNLERFTITATLERKWASWDSVLGLGKAPTAENNKALDTLTFIKRNIENKEVDRITMTGIQSVDVYNTKDKYKTTIDRHQPYYSKLLGREIEGNTVISNFSLLYNKGDPVNYFTIHNAWTLDGSWINKNGVDDQPGGGRWLVHGNATYQTSDGCFIVPNSETKNYYEQLKRLNIPKYGQIAGTLLDDRKFWIQVMGSYRR